MTNTKQRETRMKKAIKFLNAKLEDYRISADNCINNKDFRKAQYYLGCISSTKEAINLMKSV